MRSKPLRKGLDMITNVKARYSNGALVPLEPLDLEEGKEVTVSIEDVRPPGNALHVLQAVAGAWRGTHDPERVAAQHLLRSSRELPA